MNQCVIMAEKYKLKNQEPIERIFGLPENYECLMVCRYADGFVYRVLKKVAMCDELPWQGYLIFYSVNENVIYKTDIYDQIKIRMTDFEHGCPYATGFEFLKDGKWTRWDCKDEVCSDMDVHNLETNKFITKFEVNMKIDQKTLTQNSEIKRMYEELVAPFVRDSLLRKANEEEGSEDYEALTCVPAFVGDNYGGEIRPMFVGRAVNGWNTDWSTNVEEAAEQALNQNCNFDEIRNPDNYKDNKNSYNFNRCAFIQTGIEAIIKQGINREDAWSAFVWSNLFKVSPAISGNPSGKVQHKQRKICIDILKKEIELLKPTHIIFFTDEDWLKNTWRNKKDLDSFYKVFEFDKKFTNQFIKGTGIYNGVPYVVCVRPEKHKREEFSNSISDAFNYLKKSK